MKRPRPTAAFAALLLAASVAPAQPVPVTLPPVGGVPDYQLGGAYAPAATVSIVGRDRNDPPAAGRYSICYINGFQTQPGEADLWPGNLILQHNGQPVHDPGWPDEMLLDTSSASRRQQILAIVEPWIQQCASDGFQAVEFDNLDSWSRSQGLLSFQHNLQMAILYAQAAHAAGLAAGQKNDAEHTVQLHQQAGFDFAVSEECAAYNECGGYQAVYGSAVIDIEYTDNLPQPFQTLCRQRDALAMVLRDRDLTTPASAAHVFEPCDTILLDGFEPDA